MCLFWRHAAPEAEESMQIYVQPYDSEGNAGQVVVQVEPSGSIESLRTKVQQKMGIPVADQILLYGKKLDNGRTLDSYDIPEGSIIKVIRRAPGATRVIVLSLREKVFLIDFEPNDTVEKLKRKISQKFGYEMRYLRLVHAGKSLEDARTLSYYKFQNEDVAYVLVSSEAPHTL